jgi:hypothetical protein
LLHFVILFGPKKLIYQNVAAIQREVLD